MSTVGNLALLRCIETKEGGRGLHKALFWTPTLSLYFQLIISLGCLLYKESKSKKNKYHHPSPCSY